MNSLLRSLWWPCVAGVLLVLSGCSGGGGTGSPAGKIKVAFVSNNAASFWLLAEAGCKDQAKIDDVEIDFQRPRDGTSRQQKEIIDTLLAQGVKGIAISVKDPENQSDYLKDKVAAKVPLLCVDNDAPESGRRCYIGTNNVAAGKTVGKLVREALPQGGTVALFVGQIEPINARERTQGVLEELGFEGGATKSKDGKYILHTPKPLTDNVDNRTAQNNAATVLAQLKDEGNIALVGLWAYNPPAILKAVKAAKLEGKVRIVGFDEDEETLQGIDDGWIFATVVQNPYEFGRESVKYLAKLARGEKVTFPENGQKYIDARIVTKAGGGSDKRLVAKDYLKQVNEWLGK